MKSCMHKRIIAQMHRCMPSCLPGLQQHHKNKKVELSMCAVLPAMSVGNQEPLSFTKTLQKLESTNACA